MFSDEHNPVKHTVENGQCVYCKRPLAQTEYTKGEAQLLFTPNNSRPCKGLEDAHN